MVTKGFQKKKSTCTVLSIFAVMVICMFFSDLAYADGAVQGHEEIINETACYITGLTNAELHDYIPIQYSVDYNYTEAYKLVDMVNQLRVSEGRSPLIATDYLMRLAADRAAQTVVLPTHAAIVPNFPYSPGDSSIVYPYYTDTNETHKAGGPVELGENFAAASDANGAFDLFGGLDKSGQHYANLVNGSYKYIGVGFASGNCVIAFYSKNVEKSPTFDPNGEYGKLGNGSGEYTGYTPRKIAKQNFMRYCTFKTSNGDYCDGFTENQAAMSAIDNGKFYYTSKSSGKKVYNSLVCGDSLELISVGTVSNPLNLSQFTLNSSNPAVLEVSGNVVTAKKAGTAVLSIGYASAPDVNISATITVIGKDEDKKDKDEKSEVTVDLIYSKAVIDKETKTAEFTGMNKKYAKNLAGYTMPNTISYNGKSYKVTSIGNNAFKNCKNLKKITIPKNIKTIGSNAFRGCSKLQTITVQSTKITKVGKNAFKGIKKNAKIKVPKKKLAAYKKLMKGKGQKVKVVKK